MATILTKTFDTLHGCIALTVKDAVLGNVSNHTIYVALPDGTPNDVAAAIAQIEATVDAQATAIKNAFTENGWTPGGN